MSRMFDIYLAVDWSARSKPSPRTPHKDAIWWAWCGADGNSQIGYERTRHACEGRLLALLQGWQAQGLRVLAGFDFGFGYPARFAAAAELPGAGAPWLRTWAWLARHLRDDAANQNNRFAVAATLNARIGPATPGPFWACPPAWQGPTLTSKRHPEGYPYPVAPGRTLARMRHTDALSPGVQPMWKLLGIGSVGSQSLTGIPVLYRLRAALAPHLAVWPFEDRSRRGFRSPDAATDFIPQDKLQHISIDFISQDTTLNTENHPAIICAEIWPSQVPLLPSLTPDEILDRRQVRSVVARMAERDRQGQLAALLATPQFPNPSTRTACLEEEGYILPLT